jgi:hypothetical protein
MNLIRTCGQKYLIRAAWGIRDESGGRDIETGLRAQKGDRYEATPPVLSIYMCWAVARYANAQHSQIIKLK